MSVAGLVAAPRAELEVLLFELATQRFALPLVSVLEVVRAVAIRPLPNAPSVVEGIIDVRGNVVPVLDIRARFRLEAKPLELTDHFVLGNAGARCVALRVDRAISLLHVSALATEEAINLPAGIDHVSGVASLPDGLVLLHDLPLFLTDLEAGQLDEALSVSPGSPGGAG